MIGRPDHSEDHDIYIGPLRDEVVRRAVEVVRFGGRAHGKLKSAVNNYLVVAAMPAAERAQFCRQIEERRRS